MLVVVVIGFDSSSSKMKHLIFTFLRFGVETMRGVEFRYSSQKVKSIFNTRRDNINYIIII